MAKTLLIALIAGCTAALMVVSLASGSNISKALVLFAPFPLMAAALGWGALAAAFGGVMGSAALTLIDSTLAITFFLAIVAPSVWLGHLTLLAQATPSSDPQRASVEWYPLGQLLLRITLCGILAGFVVLGFLNDGTDELRKNFLEAAAKAGLRIQEPERTFEVIMLLIPSMMASTVVLILSVNLWGAAKAVSLSGRLRRPWPDLQSVALPRSAAVLLAVALVLSFVGGNVTRIAMLPLTALITAYGFVGLAVLHVVSQKWPARRLVLTGTYAATIFIGWPLLILALLGLLDSVVGLRRRSTQLPSQPHS